MNTAVLNNTNLTSLANGTPQARSTRKEMDMNMFIALLTTQLVNQNPTEPMKDAEFYTQLAQLGSVQGMDRMEKSLSVVQAQGLLGKTVTATRPGGSVDGSGEVTGKVTQMNVKNGKYFLGIQQANGGVVEVEFTSVRQVKS